MVSIIKEKKIPSWAMVLTLYVSFCMSSFMTFRGTLSALMTNFAAPSVIIDNYIIAFLLAGAVPVALYELVTRFIFRFAQVRLGGDTDLMRYSLRFFYIPANVIIFLLKLTYLAFPMLNIYGDLIFDFVVTAAFFAGYLVYVSRHVPKERISAVLYQLGGSFIIVYGLVELLAIVMEVVLI